MPAEQIAALPLEPPRVRPRIVTLGAPELCLVALGVAIAAWGLPLARDQLFLWLGLGMAAFSVSAWRSWGGMVLDWLALFALLVLYDSLRGAVAVPPGDAHVRAQLDLDKVLGAGHVPTTWLQDHLYHAG